MTVERPGTWIVGFELDDHVAFCGDEKSVAALGVVWVDDGGAIPLTRAGGENVEVVSVQVHGVDSEAGVSE